MANQYEDDMDDELETEDAPAVDNGPAQLRKALRRAEKEKKELSEQLASIQADLRSRSVKDVLTTKGVPEKIAKFIPSDIHSPEQIDAWLTENADVFGFQKAEESAPSDQPISENRAAMQRINAATHNANLPSRDADEMAKVTGAKTRAELDALIGIDSSGRLRR